MNNINDHALKDGGIGGILKKRINQMNSAKRFHRPWGSARIRKNILGFNFHLYRKPSTFRMNEIDLNRMFGDCKHASPPFGTGMTHSKWRHRISRICPRQFLIRDWWDDVHYKLERTPGDIRGWFIDNIYRKFINPRNVLKIKTLPHTWSDERTLLLHAIFQIITDFVESKPEQIVDYEDGNWGGHWKGWHTELMEVYTWWKNRDLQEEYWDKAYDGLESLRKTDKSKWISEITLLEKRKIQQTEDMLIRAIKLREGMWV